MLGLMSVKLNWNLTLTFSTVGKGKISYIKLEVDLINVQRIENLHNFPVFDLLLCLVLDSRAHAVSASSCAATRAPIGAKERHSTTVRHDLQCMSQLKQHSPHYPLSLLAEALQK